MSKDFGTKIALYFAEKLVGDVTGLTPVPRGYKNGTTDYARGCAVTVNVGTYPERLVDGNDTTYWAITSQALPFIATLDLGQSRLVYGFTCIQHTSYFGKNYTIEGSLDGDTWETYVSGTMTATYSDTFGIPRTCRYIRLTFTSRNSSSYTRPYTLSIWEAAPIGNEEAFIISGQQRKYVPDGPLLDVTYDAIGVSQRSMPSVYLDDDFSVGTFTNTVAQDGSLVIEDPATLLVGRYLTPPISLATWQSRKEFLLERGYGLKYTAIDPDGTTVEVKTAISNERDPVTQELIVPTVFTAHDSGDPVADLPAGDLTGYYLWVQVTLTATTPAVVPVVISLKLVDVLDPMKGLVIDIDPYDRFNDVEDTLTVAYDATKGNLRGLGGPVASFSQVVTPDGLSPRPDVGHNIDIVAEIDVALDFLAIWYTRMYEEETITAEMYLVVNFEKINPSAP